MMFWINTDLPCSAVSNSSICQAVVHRWNFQTGQRALQATGVSSRLPEEWRSSEAGAAGINPYVRETWEGLQEGTLLHYCY